MMTSDEQPAMTMTLEQLASDNELTRLYTRHLTSREISNLVSTCSTLRLACPDESWLRLCKRRWPFCARLVGVESFRAFYVAHANSTIAAPPLPFDDNIQIVMAIHDGNQEIVSCRLEAANSLRRIATTYTFGKVVHTGTLPGYTIDLILLDTGHFDEDYDDALNGLHEWSKQSSWRLSVTAYRPDSHEVLRLAVCEKITETEGEMLVWDGFSWPTCVGDLHGSMQLLPEVKRRGARYVIEWTFFMGIGLDSFGSDYDYKEHADDAFGLLNLMHWEDTFINHGEIEYPVASASGPLAVDEVVANMDLVRRIMEHLPARDLGNAISTCMDWRYQACDDELWRRICEARWPWAMQLGIESAPLSGFPTSRSFERFYVAHSITTKPRVRTANRRGGVQFGIDIVNGETGTVYLTGVFNGDTAVRLPCKDDVRELSLSWKLPASTQGVFAPFKTRSYLEYMSDDEERNEFHQNMCQRVNDKYGSKWRANVTAFRASDQKVLRLARGARLDGEDLAWGFGAQVAFEDSSIDASFGSVDVGLRVKPKCGRWHLGLSFHTSVDEKNGYEYEFGEEDCMELLSFFEWK